MKYGFTLSLILNVLGIFGIAFLVIQMGGISNLWSRIMNRGLTQEYFMLKDQYAQMPMDSTDILFLGNSLTYGGSWSEWLGNDYLIANRGIPGDGIEGLMGRMPHYAELHPKVVLAMIGINDLAFHRKEWLLERYPQFLAQLKKDFPDSKLVLQSILPINNTVSNTGLSNSEIDAVNMALTGYCADTRIEMLNLAVGFKNERGQLRADWTGDGLHLNGDGYKYWAAQLGEFLQAQQVLKD